VHLTGITQALSEGARSLVQRVAEGAQRAGAAVTFDANYRAALWPDAAAARQAQERLLPLVDWYFCGEDEARALWGEGDPGVLTQRIRSAGARGVVMRVGEQGAFVGAELVPPPRLVAVRDEVGAGDAFDAGFVYAMLRGLPPRACALVGHLVAARALRGTGDWETLPHLREVEGELAAAIGSS